MKGNISEDKVFEDYQGGLPEDFTLEGANIRRKSVDLQTATVQISLRMDYALLKEIQQAAEQEGLPYQTLMQRILRDYVSRAALEQRVRRIEERLAQLEARA